MKKSLYLILFLSLLAVPAVNFAAFDDVTLTTDVIINVGGINLNISGSSAVIESITVEASSFSFVLLSGSSIQVTSPDRRILSTSAASQYITINTCDSSGSVLKHASSGGSLSITITPQSSTCAISATSATGGGGVTAGAFDAPQGPFSVLINGGAAVTRSREVILTLSAGPNVVGAGSIAVSSRFSDLRDAALERYQSPKTIDLCSKLGGLVKYPENECPEGIYTVYVKFFTSEGQGSQIFSDAIEYRKSGVAEKGGLVRPLSLGSAGEDVKLLQRLLNSLGFIIASQGLGSPGKETVYFGLLTEKAVQKFQEKYGIASSGTEGYGRVGPKTLAKLLEVSNVFPPLSVPPAVGAVQEAQVFSRTLFLGTTGEDVRRLQQLLNSDPDTRVASDGPGSSGNETAYFGSLTEKAVQKFQTKHGIVSHGSPGTTGFGTVGPKTRLKLQEIFKQ